MASRDFLSDIKLSNEAILVFEDSGSNTISISAPTTVTSTYSLVLPAATPADGEVLEWDTATSAFIWSTPSSVSSINDISDVVISGTPADNELLAYNTGTSKWINQTAVEAGVAAASHNHAGEDITSGTVADTYLTSNVGLLDAVQGWSAFQQFDDFAITGVGGRHTIDSERTAGGLATLRNVDGEIPIMTDGTPLAGEFMVRSGDGYISRDLVESDVSDLGTYFDTAGAGLTSSTNTVNVIAGANTGLTVAADSVSLDINNLATETTIASGDFLPFWDITATADNKKVTFANFESTLNHDSLAGFVGNEHINHSSVTMTAGTGLTGGGTIAATRTFNVSGLTTTEFSSANISQWTNDSGYYSSGDTILVADGTEALPSISFASATDSGMYLSATDAVSISSGGNDVITFVLDNLAINPSIRTSTLDDFEVTAESLSKISSLKLVLENTTSSLGGALEFLEGTANGTGAIRLRSPASLSKNQTWLLPETAATDGVWKSTGAGATATLVCEKVSVSELVDLSGSTFPASPIDGQPFTRTDLDMPETFHWDATRSKWLGELREWIVGRDNASTSNLDLDMAGVTVSSSRGMLTPNKLCIVGIKFYSAVDFTGDLDLVEGSTKVATLYSTTIKSGSDFTINQAMDADAGWPHKWFRFTNITVGTCNNPIVSIFARREET